MVTKLDLLSSDGVVRVIFHRPLTPEHYAELHTQVCAAQDSAQLTELLGQLSDRWQIGATVEQGAFDD
jgi:hypothetical protein